MNQSRHERDVARVVTGIEHITLGFAGDIHRNPSSGELFEILTWAAKSLPDDALADVNPAQIIALKPQIKKGVQPSEDWAGRQEGESAVGDLNDSTFVIANDFLLDLTNAVRSDAGNPPTLDELTQLLTDGLHQSGIMLADVHTSDIRDVKSEVTKKRKVSIRVGDVVAIPAENGDYFLAVVLAKNVFGIAYGLFEGTSKLKPISIDSHPPATKYPVYSDDRQIVAGRWLIIGHDEELGSLFPEEPEIFHYPRGDSEAYAGVGPYGAGETASGQLRHLSREEAGEIGLLSGEYRQTYLSEYLEKYLNSKLAV